MSKLWLLAFALSLPAMGADFLPKTASFDFEQVFKSATNGKNKKTLGHMDYMYPGHIRFKVTSLDEVEYVRNKEKTWYYTPPFTQGEPGEVTIRPTNGQMDMGKFFDVLEKGLVDNELYKAQRVPGGRKIVFLAKAQKDLGMAEALITFEGGVEEFAKIKTVQLTYSDKKQAELTLKSIKTGIPFGKDHFIFTPPPNTNVSN